MKRWDEKDFPCGKSRISRAEQAGRVTGAAIVEMVHLMYQNRTAANFWRGLMKVLNENKRKLNTGKTHETQHE